jgi:hypothetical protein
MLHEQLEGGRSATQGLHRSCACVCSHTLARHAGTSTRRSSSPTRAPSGAHLASFVLGCSRYLSRSSPNHLRIISVSSPSRSSRTRAHSGAPPAAAAQLSMPVEPSGSTTVCGTRTLASGMQPVISVRACACACACGFQPAQLPARLLGRPRVPIGGARVAALAAAHAREMKREPPPLLAYVLDVGMIQYMSQDLCMNRWHGRSEHP